MYCTVTWRLTHARSMNSTVVVWVPPWDSVICKLVCMLDVPETEGVNVVL
jgi:hypothetical protein